MARSFRSQHLAVMAENERRMSALFGGLAATWEESWRECTAYLAKNQALWEGAS